MKRAALLVLAACRGEAQHAPPPPEPADARVVTAAEQVAVVHDRWPTADDLGVVHRLLGPFPSLEAFCRSTDEPEQCGPGLPAIGIRAAWPFHEVTSVDIGVAAEQGPMAPTLVYTAIETSAGWFLMSPIALDDSDNVAMILHGETRFDRLVLAYVRVGLVGPSLEKGALVCGVGTDGAVSCTGAIPLLESDGRSCEATMISDARLRVTASDGAACPIAGDHVIAFAR